MQIENLFELFLHKCAEGFNSIYQIIVKCGLKQQKKKFFISSCMRKFRSVEYSHFCCCTNVITIDLLNGTVEGFFELN